MHVGDREHAVRFIKEWLAQSVGEYLKICDPYFGPNDLDVLQWVASIKPDTKIFIVTGIAHNKGTTQPIEDEYRTKWHTAVSASEPPNTEICIAWSKDKSKFPIHDRWWITEGSGLRLGTSIGTLGVGRETEITVLSEDEAADREHEIDRVLSRLVRDYEGDRMYYKLINM